MVSGLVTSPCDQLRIFSGEARLILMASKSAIVFCISNGLERNKVFLRFSRHITSPLPAPEYERPVVQGQWPIFRYGTDCAGARSRPWLNFKNSIAFVAPASGWLSQG